MDGWTAVHGSISALYLLLGIVPPSLLVTFGLVPWALHSSAMMAVSPSTGLCRCPVIILSLCCATRCLSELLDAMLLPCTRRAGGSELIQDPLSEVSAGKVCCLQVPLSGRRNYYTQLATLINAASSAAKVGEKGTNKDT